ncbi:glutathione peroxidase [Seonamhaeicola sp. NFXS20]|uniref:glutathione peroxidase n=1 Tax=Seonamhaeicola sp. NFXS20 TaxID=2816959 RepID=UPI003B8D8A77
MDIFKTFIATLGNKTKSHKLPVNSIYDISINALNGTPINLSKFKGKYMLFVNVASKCGFTPQYQDLQKLHEHYGENLQVIGVPCNQFGKQEPGNTDEIKSFCEINYGVSFLITEKLNVKGKNQHPLYTWLTQKINNEKTDSTVKWNFQKYLLDPNGNLIDFYLPYTKPLSKKIIKHL